MATTTAPAAAVPPLPASHHPSRAVKLSSMPRDAVAMIGNDVLPPMVPSFVQVGSKSVSTAKKCRAWQWAPFTTSGRSDGQEFRHWVRAGVEYPDYPYARFDIHLESITYSDEEYSKYLQHSQWTKSDTDALMELCRVYELRWAVIYDRWHDAPQHRKLEELQHRYYVVAATLAQVRITKEAATEVSALASSSPAAETTTLVLETAAARALATAEPQHQPLVQFPQTGTSNKSVFDLTRETERRKYLDLLWHRGKAEEEEELEMRKELKLIDAQLRKLKKSGGHVAAAAQSRAVSPVPTAAMLDSAFSSTAPTPMPKTPYLQSGRLVPPATGTGGINKISLKRMDGILVEELKINPKPLCTKRICDLYDAVRKNTLTLLTLQKVVLQKEGQLQTKRLRLAKLGGGGGMTEEALLGIAPVPAPAPPTAAHRGSTSKKSSSKQQQHQQRPSSSSNTKSKSTKPPSKKAPATKKRKSKADSVPVPLPVAPPTSAAVAAAAAAAAAAAGDSVAPKKRAKKS